MKPQNGPQISPETQVDGENLLTNLARRLVFVICICTVVCRAVSPCFLLGMSEGHGHDVSELDSGSDSE